MLVRFLRIFFVVLMVGVASVHAQRGDECVAEAQVWYDAIDEEEIALSYTDVINPDARTSARYDALDTIETLQEKIRDADYPVCIRVARDWYLEGLEALIQSSRDMLDEELSAYFFSSMEAFQKIGQVRGFLKAVGVPIREDSDTTFYFK